MSEAKLYAGHAIRKLRRGVEQTQAEMAGALGISPSYLNLIERNQRPVTAAILVRLTERYDFDPRALNASPPGGGADALRRRLADPLFADLGIDAAMVDDWMMAHPEAAEAFARVFDRAGSGSVSETEPVALAAVRREIERWRNHFGDLDAQAELVADELRQTGSETYAALVERLRERHRISVRVLPVETMPDHLRRLDLHSRQLQLSELLDPASRTFACALQLGQIEAAAEVDALVRGAAFAEAESGRFYRRHLQSYFAAAVMMPYSRFFRACETSGYDLPLLQRRFGAGFEMVAHRLTTLQRVGARGLPFFMIRIDRAGVASKRFAGASNSPLVESGARCPLWTIHSAFDSAGRIHTQLVELEDGSRWLTLARTVRPQGGQIGRLASEFAIGLGVEAGRAGRLAAARGVSLEEPTLIGPGCSLCLRARCPQRSLPPQGRALRFDEGERGLSPFSFAGPGAA